ncbi:uncharacterized protein LOC120112014 [Phoenix dactylifera]|uniref:Uncharacterized protein LOC120112014 n=1 Tax=Phoenix dactylifera TaxID=42345 RepID=A0A8B9AJK7_PHODC|nr:uncharacterized protein LOC120112014 [Phoenix dactylifera]
MKSKLHTANYLSHIIQTISSICGRCERDPEMIDHIFFQCTKVTPIWIAIRPFGRPLLISTNRVLHFILSKADSEENSLWQSCLASLSWIMWKSRNEFLFQDQDRAPMEILGAADGIVSEWYDSMNDRKLKEIKTQYRWFFCFYNSNNADAGVVLRNHDANVLHAGSRILPAHSPLLAEAWARVNSQNHE